MKRFISIILVIMILIGAFSTAVFSAGALDTSLYSYVVLDDGTIEIYNYHGYETDIIIPDTINGYKVSVIGYCAFSDRNFINSVKIPNGVITIESGAFSFCEGLTHVDIPKSVKYIEMGAFLHCLSLKNVILSKNVTKIDQYAFGYYTVYVESTNKYVVNNLSMHDFTITGFNNCTAQAYAGGNSIKYNLLTRYGDVNKDNDISIIDATEIQKYLSESVSLDSESLYLADANGDGAVDIIDATQIQKYLADLVNELG